MAKMVSEAYLRGESWAVSVTIHFDSASATERSTPLPLLGWLVIYLLQKTVSSLRTGHAMD